MKFCKLEEEQWEKDLDAELQDYELVTDGSGNSRKGPSDDTISNEEWEKDVEDLLGEHEWITFILSNHTRNKYIYIN